MIDRTSLVTFHVLHKLAWLSPDVRHACTMADIRAGMATRDIRPDDTRLEAYVRRFLEYFLAEYGNHGLVI